MWVKKGYGFEILFIPDIIIVDAFFHTLVKKYNAKASVFKIQEKFFYKWHTDAGRQASINIQLISNHSHTVFSGSYDEFGNKPNLVELQYEENGVYLLNTQHEHAVMNLGEDRFILGITFGTNDTYDSIKHFCIEHNL